MKIRGKYQRGDPEAMIQGMVAALRRIIRAVDLRSRYLATHYGLTGPQLVVLSELSANGGCCVSDLSKAVDLGPATTSGILDRLEKRSLVRRERSGQDKRRVLVSLTEAGEQLLIDAPSLLQEEFAEEFGKLEDWERTQMLWLLQRLGSMMEAKGLAGTGALGAGPAATTSAPTGASLQESPLPTEASGDAPGPGGRKEAKHGHRLPGSRGPRQ